MPWNYKRNETKSFQPIPVGQYRIRINKVEKAVSAAGNNMLSFTFDVSGRKSKLFYNLVFLNDKPDITNRNLTNFYDSFKDIPEGDTNTANWIGKVGACQVKHEEYNGEMRARIHYFIEADKQAGLPAWVEPESTQDAPINNSSVPDDGQFHPAADDSLPFF